MNKIFFSQKMSDREKHLRISKFVGLFNETLDIKNNIFIPTLSDLKYEIFPEPENNPVKEYYEGDVTIRESGNYILARIELFEDKNNSLEELTYKAYIEFFNLIEKTGFNLVRIWNYIPNILDHHNDLERYRQFNIGRWNAWQECGPKLKDRTPIRPATTGIGSFGGPLIIEVLLSRYAVDHIENPRQRQFVHYSEKWGPKPPISARGTILHTPKGSTVYISGTASLIGEEVAHGGDVEKQTIETLENIKILISEENMKNYSNKGYTLDQVDSIRVYIKNSEDFKIVEKTLATVWGDKEILYVQDDICRPGFLIEIEGVVYPN